MELTYDFLGHWLNAVDAKGRVSLPAPLRQVVEKRLRPDLPSSEFPPDERKINLGEHEEMTCLEGFDPTYTRYLAEEVTRRAGKDDDGGLAAWNREAADLFSAAVPVNFDEVGRMVISAMHRSFVGITNLAFFVGIGRSFQIWSPEHFRREQPGNKRALRALDYMLAERAGRA